MTKCLGVLWFNTVGIVRAQTELDGIKYYIRACHPHVTEQEDIEYIMDWGSTFPSEAGDVLFGVKS